MKVKKILLTVLITGIGIALSSCGTANVYEKVYPTLNDKMYDSEFPYRSCSAQLEEISSSVKLVTVAAYYESYIFPESAHLTITDVKGKNFKPKAERTISYSNSIGGTATVIYSEGRHIALLTCAHVVDFPDTTITYYSKNGVATPFIQSVSVKVSQQNFIPELPEKGYVDILAMDRKNDIAIVGKTLASIESNTNVPVFKYPNGSAAELRWGDFVYIFGYPMNYKMVSKAIVSSPDKNKGYSFLIDAVFNRGFSGGIVLAVRDGVPNFELVGIVKSVPAETEYTVRPLVKDAEIDTNPWIPYTGEFALEKRQNIRFGIVKVVGIEAIKDFFKQNKDKLEEKGFYISSFTK